MIGIVSNTPSNETHTATTAVASVKPHYVSSPVTPANTGSLRRTHGSDGTPGVGSF